MEVAAIVAALIALRRYPFPFIVMIIASVVAGIYAGRGLLRAVNRFLRRGDREPKS